MKKLLFIMSFLMGILVFPHKAISQVDISITANVAPPELPVYSQPSCPVNGYLWTPGYWAYDNGDYYWVPGVWVSPPQPGYLWTPFYWGFENGNYGLHPGYWGRDIGFYGGVNYGYGYGGSGFYGGRWEGNRFNYNTAVVNVNTTVIHNTYIDRTVIINNPIANDHRSFNGGDHGVNARPTPREQSVIKEHHFAPTHIQSVHEQAARHDKSQFVSVNHGRPATTAVPTVRSSNFGHKSDHSRARNDASLPHGQEGANPYVQGGNNNVHQQNHTSNPSLPIHQQTPMSHQHNETNQNAVNNQQNNNQRSVRQPQPPQPQPMRHEQPQPQHQQERQQLQPLRQVQQQVRQPPQPVRQQQQHQPQQAPHEVHP